MSASYDSYFASRLYDERYPGPNRRTLSLVRSILSHNAEPGDVIDIGAGNGRYALPLATETPHRVWAVERSAAARGQLSDRRRGMPRPVALCLRERIAEVPLPDLDIRVVLALFGVLSNMDHAERRKTLSALAPHMDTSAALVGSVPNSRRRFRSEQRSEGARSDGHGIRVSYSRPVQTGNGEARFDLTLFSEQGLVRELDSLGWSVQKVTAESVLPESVVTRRWPLGTLDGLVASWIPPALGYGLLFIARPSDSS